MKKCTFEDFARTTSGRCAETLLADHTVKPEQIYQTMSAELEFGMPSLVEGGKYTTAMLCDPAIWTPWKTAEHRVAGMCVAFMVRKSLVHLQLHTTRSGKGTKRYKKIVPINPGGEKPTIIDCGDAHGSDGHVL